MKKNISINISGIIFHIEEDGYENLRKYLDSINKYFSSFEDSSEIMADIESRIAEIFLTKLNEGKQIVTVDDVNSLITTMGSVSDFKAAEEQTEQATGYDAGKSAQETQKKYSPPKQLLRDQKRKILGGVCSGLGSYLNVDPVWIRLLFALTVFAYGITFIAYIIMWIVVPGSYDLDEPEVSKKMFRDPERKVISGVSGGVASFIGIDIIAVRVLFIIFTIAGGFGFLIYIVLWVVLPEAKTLTDKMQMQGEPVTLSNIESTIKKNQTLGGNAEETTFTKILLLPFRFIGAVLGVIGKILVPVAEVLRVAIGIFIALLGLALVFSIVLTGGILLGIFSGVSFPAWLTPGFNEVGFPVEIFSNTFPALSIVATVLVGFVPCLFVLLLGISVIAKRVVFGAAVGWVLFVLFFGSLVVVGVTVPKIVYAFKEDGEYKIEDKYQSSGKKLYLKINEIGLDDYKVTHLELKGYEGKELKLIQTFEAQGSTKQNAIENAKMVDYHVVFSDSTLTFDSNIKFKKDAKFRAQRLNMVLYIPYDFPFVLDKNASRFIAQYIDRDDLDGNTWKMTSKGLTCTTCPEKHQHNDHDELTEFDELHINGVINATIRQGDEYAVELIGSDADKKKYNIHQDGNTLYIDFDDDDKFFWKKNFNWNEMKINITMPDITRLEAKGAGKMHFINFTTDNIDMEILGAMKVYGEFHVENLNAEVSGASELDLQGDSHTMDCTIQGASSLRAYNFEVEDATVNAHGASHAKVNVTGTLEMNKGIASGIDYKGNPTIVKKD
jgi:phage shock protein PspC (stress-responsive transcriptional regulator)